MLILPSCQSHLLTPLQPTQCLRRCPQLQRSRLVDIPSHHDTLHTRLMHPLPFKPSCYPASMEHEATANKFNAIASKQGVVDVTTLVPITTPIKLSAINPDIFSTVGIHKRTSQDTVRSWTDCFPDYDRFQPKMHGKDTSAHDFYVTRMTGRHGVDPFGGNQLALFGKCENFIGPLFQFCRGVGSDKNIKDQSIIQHIITFICMQYWCLIRSRFLVVSCDPKKVNQFSEALPKSLVMLFERTDWAMKTDLVQLDAILKSITPSSLSTAVVPAQKRHKATPATIATTSSKPSDSWLDHMKATATQLNNSNLPLIAETHSFSQFVYVVLLYVMQLEQVDCRRYHQQSPILTESSVVKWCTKKLPQNATQAIETCHFSTLIIKDIGEKVNRLAREHIFGSTGDDDDGSGDGGGAGNGIQIGPQIITHRETKSFASSQHRQIRPSAVPRKPTTSTASSSSSNKRKGHPDQQQQQQQQQQQLQIQAPQTHNNNNNNNSKPDHYYADFIPSLVTHNFFHPDRPVISIPVEYRTEIDRTQFHYTTKGSGLLDTSSIQPNDHPHEANILGRYFQMWQQICAFVPTKRTGINTNTRLVFGRSANEVPDYLYDAQAPSAFVRPTISTATAAVADPSAVYMYTPRPQHLRDLPLAVKRYCYHRSDNTANSQSLSLYIPRLCENPIGIDVDEASPFSISFPFWRFAIAKECSITFAGISERVKRCIKPYINTPMAALPEGWRQLRRWTDSSSKWYAYNHTEMGDISIVDADAVCELYEFIVDPPVTCLMPVSSQSIYQLFYAIGYFVKTEEEQVASFYRLVCSHDKRELDPLYVHHQLRTSYSKELKNIAQSAQTIREIWPAAWHEFNRTYRQWDYRQPEPLPPVLLTSDHSDQPFMLVARRLKAFIIRLSHGGNDYPPDRAWGSIGTVIRSIYAGVLTVDIWNAVQEWQVTVTNRSEIKVIQGDAFIRFVLMEYARHILAPLSRIWQHMFTPPCIHLHGHTSWVDHLTARDLTPHITGTLEMLASNMLAGQNGDRLRKELALVINSAGDILSTQNRSFLAGAYHIIKHLDESTRSSSSSAATLQLLHQILAGAPLPSPNIARDAFVSQWSAVFGVYIDMDHVVPVHRLVPFQEDVIQQFITSKRDVALGRTPAIAEKDTPTALLLDVLADAVSKKMTRRRAVASFLCGKIPLPVSKNFFETIRRLARDHPVLGSLFHGMDSNSISSSNNNTSVAVSFLQR